MALVRSKSDGSHQEPVRAFINGIAQMISIPRTQSEIRNLISRASYKGTHHPGLLMALRSLRSRRSARNAYILLLGQTGAGKSSTINFLFDNNNITETGDSASQTSTIIEFSALVPVAELGAANTEIRVIDTPGLGDTRGIENDAKFIATLSHYLKSHEDLSTAIPNIILLVARFDDTRMAGDSSGFVRMLKGIKLLEDQLVDKVFSNIIIVLTHYTNVKKAIQKDPSERYEIFRKLVKDEGFPEPIIVIGGENEAVEKELPEMNGYYVLPNGECYPYNMFQRIQQLATNNDPMGEAIIRTAFQHPERLDVIRRCEMELMVENIDEMYYKALQALIDSQFKIKETPVTAKLDYVWNNSMNPDLRKTYPGSLRIVQNVFQVRQINELSQIPNTPEDVVKLLKQIPQNEAISTLLSKAFKMVVPDLNINFLVGQGYNLLEDTVMQHSPFEFENVQYKLSPLGYKIPAGIKCELINETDDVCVVSQSLNEYKSKRLTDLNLDGEVLPEGRSTFQPRSGYNVIQAGVANQRNISTVREHRMFQLSLEPDAEFTKDFVQLVKALPKYSDQVHIRQMWQSAFDKYGTHIIVSAYGGGSIETYVQEQHAQQLIERTGGDVKRALSCLVQFDGDIEAESGSFGQQREAFKSYGVRFKGGSMKYHKSNLSEIDSDEAAATIENWRESLTIEPTMLETKLKLVPLSYYVKQVSDKVASEMEAACTNMFKSPFRYRPETLKHPPKRKDVPMPSHFGKSSCLKQGTLIRMADGSSKPVEDVQAGDIVLDMNLEPASVIGANYFYLGDRSFYGFSAESQFFTEVHIFVGPASTYRVVSKAALLNENPAMEHIENIKSMAGDFKMLTLNEDTGNVEPVICELYEDQTVYPVDTPVYFIEVASPSGTYIANGFVCRHELPPFQIWPNTFECLQDMLLDTNLIRKIMDIEMSPSMQLKFSAITDSIAQMLDAGLQSGEFIYSVDLQPESANQPKRDRTEILRNLAFVLSSRSLCAFGLLLYGKCGKILYNFLDSQESSIRKHVRVELVRSQIMRIFNEHVA